LNRMGMEVFRLDCNGMVLIVTMRRMTVKEDLSTGTNLGHQNKQACCDTQRGSRRPGN
jgi:hypothetical protein